MAVNPDYAGRTFPATDPYEVSRVKIAEFADAIGDPSPLYRDVEAAKAAGYPDVIAPPTFPIVVTMAASGVAMRDPGLGLNYAMVVHGEQRFESARPLRAGDLVIAQSTIETIRPFGNNVRLTTRTEVRTTAGEHVCTAFSTLVERGTGGDAG
ncbi:MAG TPA: MaoC family dehydratase N-terminal domain-containing protein [Streptosporangiaceae bacterium]|nr:MaoC family dehydratase N-terminal domain-containing protein [Streptosporangiaceae bacterium]